MKHSNKLIHVDAMMAWRRNGNTGKIFLDRATDGEQWSSSYQAENRTLDGPQSRSGLFGE
jgi:hypothetical protein